MTLQAWEVQQGGQVRDKDGRRVVTLARPASGVPKAIRDADERTVVVMEGRD